MMELDENDTQWTDGARESFRTAAANLVEAIRQHSAALLELTGTDADTETIAEAGEHLEAAASAYADAQYELTGTVPPLGLDEEEEYEYDEADELDAVEAESEDAGEPEESGELDESGEPRIRLTVLHRADFVVTDELAVIQAGKEAYHESWDPADDEEPVDVTDLGEALQQLRQSGGVEALADAPGLASAGATTWVLEATELLDEHEPDEWPDSPFAIGEDVPQRLLHRVDEVVG